MRKLILALLLAAWPAAAQFNNAIFEEMFDDRTTTGEVNLDRNIGQSQHVVQVVATSQPTKTCVAHSVDIVFEGAFSSGGPWERLGAPITNIPSEAGTLVASARAHGAFPFVRVNLATLDTTNCQYTGKYTGTLFPFGLIPNIIPTSRQSGLTQVLINESTSGDRTIVSAVTGGKVCLYELLIYNDTTQTVTLKSGAATNISGPWLLGNKAGFYANNTGNFHFCTDVGDAFVINLSAGTQLSGWALFRVE